MPEKSSNLEGRNILLGVSGGIAAYKTVDLAGKLTAAAANVNTVMTEAACHLIGPKTFEAVTNSAVFTSLWNSCGQYKVADSAAQEPSHIKLADWADIVVVAPATADIIAKIANGICDEILSTILCACWPLIKAGATLLAPAMNDNMWTNPAVQNNVKTVQEMGFQLIGPEKGRLASGKNAIGRMAEPQDICKAVEKIASKIKRRKK